MGNSNLMKAKGLAVRVISYLLPLTSYLLFSCTQDGYEKGDGKYSNMRGDFVEAQVGAEKEIVFLTTDDGETLPLTQPYSAKWITRPDTVYRCMLYYNKVRVVNGLYAAEPISIGEVPCPIITPLAELSMHNCQNPKYSYGLNFHHFSSWAEPIGKEQKPL